MIDKRTTRLLNAANVIAAFALLAMLAPQAVDAVGRLSGVRIAIDFARSDAIDAEPRRESPPSRP